MSRIYYLIYCLLLLGITQNISMAAEPADAIQGHVDTAIQLMKDAWAYPPRMKQDIEEKGKAFDLELDSIAKYVNSEELESANNAEGESIKSKLIVIANYRKNNQARIEQIVDRFSQPENRSYPSRVAPKPPKVTAAWASADDRLAWEYLRLRPVGGASEFFVRRIGEALAVIADPRSVITITTSLKATLTDKALPGSYREKHQVLMLQTLAHMPNPESLRALLDAKNWLKAAPAYIPKEGETVKWRPVNQELINHPEKVLQTGTTDKEKQKWNEVIDQYSKTVSPDVLNRLKIFKRELDINR